MVEQIMIYFLELVEELLEYIMIIYSVQNTTCFPDGVHAQHPASHVDCLDSRS